MKVSGLEEFKPLQKTSLEEEEVLQGKFDTFSKKEIPDEEIIQRKSEVIQNKQSVIDRHKLLQINEENGRGASDRQMPLQLEKEDKTNLPDRHKLLQINKENNTGLPDDMKTGIESLSGLSMDNVRVHYNSDKPAKVGAQAYTQGTDIHVAPEQEKHLPHEAWHLVQQAQGRVRPTMQLKGVAVNDDERLEKEADVLGQTSCSPNVPKLGHPQETEEVKNNNNDLVVQRKISEDELETKKDKMRFKTIKKKYYTRFSLTVPDYEQIDSYNVLSFDDCCDKAYTLDELEKMVDTQISKADEARDKALAKSAAPAPTMPVTTVGPAPAPQEDSAPKKEPASHKKAASSHKKSAASHSMSLAEFYAITPESSPPPSAWDKKLEYKPEKATSSSSQDTAPAKSHHTSDGVISNLEKWKPGKEGHSGEKNMDLSLEDLDRITAWAEKQGKYKIVWGPGTGEHASEYQFKIIHKSVTVTHDQKKATYHISITKSLYDQVVEIYGYSQDE